MFDSATDLIIKLGVFFSEYFKKHNVSNFGVFIIIFCTFLPLVSLGLYRVELISKALYFIVLGTLLHTLLAFLLVMYVRRKEQQQNNHEENKSH